MNTKNILIAATLLLCSAGFLSAQSFTAALKYQNTPITGAPSNEGSRLRFALNTGRLYEYDPINLTWRLVAQGIDITGTGAAPNYTPAYGQSTLALSTISGGDSLYYYRAGSWHHLNPAGGGSGTVTSVAAAAPAAGFTISGSPITTAGTLTFTLANDLAALEGLSGTGIVTRTAAETYTTRTVTAGTGISVADGSGVSGNPTITNTGDLSNTNEIQTIDTFSRSGLTVSLSLSSDGQPAKTITLPTDTDTNIYNSDGSIPAATTRNVNISDDYARLKFKYANAATSVEINGGDPADGYFYVQSPDGNKNMTIFNDNIDINSSSNNIRILPDSTTTNKRFACTADTATFQENSFVTKAMLRDWVGNAGGGGGANIYNSDGFFPPNEQRYARLDTGTILRFSYPNNDLAIEITSNSDSSTLDGQVYIGDGSGESTINLNNSGVLVTYPNEQSISLRSSSNTAHINQFIESTEIRNQSQGGEFANVFIDTLGQRVTLASETLSEANQVGFNRTVGDGLYINLDGLPTPGQVLVAGSDQTFHFADRDTLTDAITALTGDVTATGPGSVAATISNNAVTGAKIAMGSDAAGDIIYYNGTDYVRLPIGTANQQLRVNAGATAPEWATISGGGITSLNTLTAGTQTFATGTAGTDFAISSATSTHTFNLPTASATNRGALSSADWTTFNNKGNGDILNGGNTTGAAVTIGTNDANALNLETSNVTALSLSSVGNLTLTPTLTATGALKGIVYTGQVNTNQTLSTEIPAVTITTAGRQWATGALTTQREVLITQPTYSFVGASTITDAATLGIAGAPIKSTNATITNTHGILVQAGAVSTATNSYGLSVNAQTGATNNYAAQFIGGNVGIGTASPSTGRLEIVAGSLADAKNALRVSATLPSVQSTNNNMVDFQLTGAGSSSIAWVGLNIDVLAGYTGSEYNTAGRIVNYTAGTGTGIAVIAGNVGNTAGAVATTTGSNVGCYGVAASGNKNAGITGRAVTTKNSATNVGVVGVGLNGGTSPVQIGGFFGLMSTEPTFTSAALIADNGSQTSPIFLARDNGSVILNLIDGGRMFLGGSTSPTAVLHLAAGTATANTAPLKFTSGTNLTTAEAGAIEYDGTELYFSPSTTRYKLAQVKAGSSTIESGTYTPTRSAEVNMDANVTVTDAQYMRVGNTVTVSGRFTADPTTATNVTSFQITLPIASNLGAAEDAAGTAFCSTIAGMGAAVLAIAANDTAMIQWIASDVASQSWSYTITYKIL